MSYVLFSEQERMEKLEADFRRMADELDVAKAGAAELSKLQDTVEKYKQKLEQVAAAKQRIKELEDKGEQYLEQVSPSSGWMDQFGQLTDRLSYGTVPPQIMNLEDQVKSIPGLQKLIDQYKQEKMDLEKLRFEELTASKVGRRHVTPYAAWSMAFTNGVCLLLMTVEGRGDRQAERRA